MGIFGKSLGDYVRFEWPALVIVPAVALLRWILSAEGVGTSSVRWLSATVALLVCALVYSALVHTRGFGSYKQVLPLVWLQAVAANVVIIAAIATAIFTGRDNIFTIPEFAGGQDGKNWFPHVFGHVLAGAVVEPLILWGLGSLVLLITRKAAGARSAAG